ncbi:ANTAR domain-containing protein [Streptomyces sp. MMBL 11-3]|uniref:ANTAR domain-containing protein n=1 Tax=Streptomyces sp. MMBL 11-3 TaxID=3382639 RepID=UPI0039B6C235
MQLQQAVHAHAVIDQAIGVVVTVGRLPPERGWHVLREISQRTNTKLRTVTEHLVDRPRTHDLPETFATELYRQLEDAHILHVQQ